MFDFRKLSVICTVSVLTATGALAQTAVQPQASTDNAPNQPAKEYSPTVGQAGKDVIWVPTSQALIDLMLKTAQVTKDDYVIDLGSGDGRTVITAAQLGARAHGIEYNPDMVALSKRSAEAAGVTDRATFAQGDIFASDFSEATVITLFLLPQLNAKLRPILLDMKPGTRVVSNSFDMGDWEADQRLEATTGCTSYCNAYYWVVPAKVEGTWRLGDAALTLNQTYQTLNGTLTRNGQATPISDAKLNGRAITFTAGDSRYSGQVDEDGKMSGSIEGGGKWSAERSAN